MKLLRVLATDDYVERESRDERTFKFDEFGTLIGLRNAEALFASKSEAIEWLSKDGFDEVDLASMDFREFNYVPALPRADGLSTVIPHGAIYEKLSVIGLDGEVIIEGGEF